MNRTKIEYVDFTWNPVTGCRRGCSYCYARRMAQRLKGRYGYPADDPFRPTMHIEKLTEPCVLRKPSRLFVCSQAELFTEGQDEWVKAVFRTVRLASWHTYLFLTKNYEQLPRWNPWPENAWVGASATSTGEFIVAHKNLIRVNARIKFVSFEPLRERIAFSQYALAVELSGVVDWVILGAMTGPKAKQNAPHLEWVHEIVEAADKAGIPVFEKDNLALPALRQEFPDA